MKYLALIICLVSTAAFAANGKVPQEWLSSESDLYQKSSSLDSTAELQQLDQAYNNILDSKQELFKTIPEDSHKRWQLQSIKTEIAVEASGNIGVMGVGGESAVELVWIRKGSQGPNRLMAQPVLSDITDSQAESLLISGQMNEDAIAREISPMVDLAMASGHVKKRKRLFKNLFNEALKFQKTVKELENSPVLGPWYAYKYQLELYVSAEGTIGFVAIGNSIRLRMEWYRLKKNTPSEMIIPQLPTELSSNAKFIASIASDLESVDQVEFDNNFRLTTMKIGVGTTIKGKFFLVKSKAKAKGAIFFKRDEVTPGSIRLPDYVSDLSSYNFREGDENHQISRYHFMNGLRKSASISRFFANRARTKGEGKFELDVIETEFELFRTGGIGMVSVEGSASISLFVTRNVSI